MQGKLQTIKTKSPGKVLDTEFAGYKAELDKVRVRLQMLESLDLTQWLAKSGSAKDRINSMILGTDEAKNNYLEVIKGALEAKLNDGVVELTPTEAEQLKQIKAILTGTPQDDGTKITIAELKGVLHGTDASATAATYHLEV
jgi:hypothetical protein